MKVDFNAIRADAAGAEAAGFLLAGQQALIHQQGWLKMLAPRAAGGAELPLPQVVRLEEAIAEADGSMGWVVTLCAGAGWFAGFLAPDTAREVISTPQVCLAGSGAPTGFADKEGEGYRITGRWDIASGAPMATHFTLNAVLRENGQPLAGPDGAPRIRAFVVPAALVVVEPTWRSFGMKGSASHAYRIEGAWVPARHGFMIDPAHATAPGTLYRFPFMLLAWVTLAANLSGMARHFLSLAREIVAARRQPPASAPDALARAAVALEGARERMYALLDQAWAQAGGEGNGGCVDDALDAQLREASMALVLAARRSVGEIYPYCGLRAAQEDSEINRVWRDFHTASQHALFTP
ncbi:MULTISPECIES: acyl-CoA dehydrogenase [unclassified Duganella]|uniref:acyl-CoA dehydrogenase n=1 Tax=unclassified Duganella TaxID=2636909 RepID=UPI0006F43DDA|nr:MULTISPECIES: acyl-CoA dehydrogenase [unclassified Duganella]KQV54301.1 acyl-CoA dehydrogenase [Duganella sp. Root336D2]KRC03427.1 acyl-CoA dehydrogenase [Duganella sp. Root198D2]